MAETTTFGYENEDGKIYYIISSDMSLDDAQSYLILRATPIHPDKLIISNSITEYFDENNFSKEKSSLRILYMLDGTTKCRRWGYVGEFIFKV